MAYVIIDTETAPRVKFSDNKPHPEASLVYDFGYIIVNNGEPVVKRSFVVTETFYNAQLMNSAYYADKLPQYHEGMGEEWKPVSFIEAWKQFCEDCKEWKVKTAWAYNADFDKKALNATISHYSNGFREYFLPYGVKWADLWAFAGSTICATKKYCTWAINNSAFTDKGNISTNAENVFRYLMNDTAFTESHTALSDCECELAILQACKRRKQARPKTKAGYYAMKNNWYIQKRIADSL